MPFCKVSWWKNVNKMEKNSLPNLQIVSLGKMAGKPLSWRLFEYELVVKNF